MSGEGNADRRVAAPASPIRMGWGTRPELSAAVLVAAVCAGCANDWRTDMWFQPSIAARVTPRPEPGGSVPLFARVHLDEREDADALKAQGEPGEASIERGRALFLERCQACHGHQGHGGGPVSKHFPPAPDLAYASVRARSDGFLYATVSLGGKAMPPMGEGLDERDRWDLVRFVRHVQATSPSVGGPDQPPKPGAQ